MSTRYNTGNPIESTDVRDMSDNAKNFDEFSNSTGNEFTDRFGVERNTIHGMNSVFDSQILNMGFTRIGTFAVGATLTNPRQTLLWAIADGGDGQEYGWSGSFLPEGKIVPPRSTPLTTGGISVGAWISRFDPALRIQARETLRRVCLYSGNNLVGGSFQVGFTLVNSNDVALDEDTGKVFSGPAGNYPQNTDPLTGPFADKSEELVSFLQSGIGSVRRSAESKMGESVSPGDFGGVGDLVALDSSSVQKSFNTERPVKLVANIGYKVTSGLTNNCAAMVHGEGLISALVFSGLGSSVDALTFSPPADGNAREYAGLSGAYVLQSSGGRHAVLVDVSASGQIVSRFKVDSSYLRANGLGNYAFAVNNPSNAADRFFLANFDWSVFDGGMLLGGVGDSINIKSSTFTGVNEALYLKQTTESSPGAFGPSSMCVFEGNNSTANKGLYIVDAQSPKIRDNNLECGAGPGAGAEQALINLKGLTKRIFGAEVTGNAILHAPNCTTGVFVGNTDGALVENNVFGVAATGYSIVVSVDAKNTRIGYNSFSPKGTGREVQDLGVGTMGVSKTPSLLNSWVSASGLQPVSFIKTLDRVVNISGVMANGVVTAGTQLFVLPWGFRPEYRQFFSSYGLTSGGVFVTVVIRVDTDGSVILANSSGGASSLVELGLCGISFIGVDVE